MRIPPKLLIAVVFCGLSFCNSWPQDEPRRTAPPQSIANQADRTDRALDQEDRLSLLAASLDAHVRRSSEHDCSHLVHAIYKRAGFPYAYAPSSYLYAGIEGFQRVKLPEPGDLVVWRGHVGIVIKPSQHIFFSFMRSGPGIDDYQAPYWKSRGRPRFYRYVKNEACERCDSAGPRHHQLLKIKE